MSALLASPLRYQHHATSLPILQFPIVRYSDEGGVLVQSREIALLLAAAGCASQASAPAKSAETAARLDQA